MRKSKIGFWAAFVFALGIVSYPAIAAETLRIGAMHPFTGPLATLANESFNGATIASDMLNEKGGIWGKKVEWVKADGVDAKKAMGEAERLISVEKLTIITGTYGSSISYAASEVAEKNKVIFWETTSYADAITERGFKYLFRVNGPASKVGALAAEFVHEVCAPKLGMDPSKIGVGIINEDSLAGTTVGKGALKRAKELGLNVVATEIYNHKTVDLSSLVMILRAKKPDVIICLSYLEDGLLFWRQAKDLNLNVKAFIGMGACHGMPDWARSLGDEANYVFNVDPAIGINPAIFKGKTESVLKEFQARFNKRFGHIPAVHASTGFDGARVLLEEVLPRAGSLDPEAVRNAALQVDIPPGGSIFGFGVKFAPPGHPNAGQNLRAHPVLMQWQEQKQWVVYPKEFSTKNVLLPMPTWEERAKGITRFVK